MATSNRSFYVPHGITFAGNGLQTVAFSNAAIADYLPIYSGNLANLQGDVITTANVSAAAYLGDAGYLSNITASNVVGTVSLAGTVTTNAQPNITSVGILTLLSVTGNTDAGNINITNRISLGAGNLQLLNNTISSTGNLITIDPVGDGQPTTGNVKILGNLSVLGNIVYNDIENATTNALVWIAASNATSAAAATGAGLQISTNDYASWTYNQGGNTWTTAIDITSANVTATGNITGDYFIGNGSQLTGLPASYSDANVVTFLQSGNALNISITGNITANNANIGNDLSVSGDTSLVGNIAVDGWANIDGQANISNSLIVASNATVGNLSTAGNVAGNNIVVGFGGNLWIGNTPFYRTLTVGMPGRAPEPVTVPLSSFNVLQIPLAHGGNANVTTT